MIWRSNKLICRNPRSLYHQKVNSKRNQSSNLDPLLTLTKPDKQIICNKNITNITMESNSLNCSIQSLPERSLHNFNSLSMESHKHVPNIEIDNPTKQKWEEKENSDFGEPLKENLISDCTQSVKNLKVLPPSHVTDHRSFKGSQFSLAAPDDSLYSFAVCRSMTNIEREVNETIKSNNKASEKTSCLDKMFDASLFKNWLFRLMMIYAPLSSALNFLIIYMPVIAVQVGISKQEAALFMTISGIMDLVTRIFIGFIADTGCIAKYQMIVSSFFVLSVLCHTSRFFISHDTFLIFVMLIGVFGGFRQNLLTSMITDYVGIEKMAKGNGFCAMLATLFISSNHPIIGSILDATGYITMPLHYIGIFLVITTIVMAFEPFFVYLEKKRQKGIIDC